MHCWAILDPDLGTVTCRFFELPGGKPPGPPPGPYHGTAEEFVVPPSI